MHIVKFSIYSTSFSTMHTIITNISVGVAETGVVFSLCDYTPSQFFTIRQIDKHGVL